MTVVTTESIAGRKTLRTLGIVKGNTVRACHIGEDLMAFMKNLVGGELSEYTEVIAQAREQAIDRMIEEAKTLGANAVLGLRFSTFYVTQGAAEIMAYGTAVLIE
jgi:uncharacterized protein YbjQ (UPF0145 family)